MTVAAGADVPGERVPPAPGAAGLAADRAYCRAALPAVSRTFALNIRLLGGSMSESVRIAYLLARIADTIEDAWPGERPELERRFGQLMAAIEADAAAADDLVDASACLRGRVSEPHVTLMHRLPSVLRAYAALREPDRAAIADALRVMTAGMCKFAARAADRRQGAGPTQRLVPYIDDEAELYEYCWVVAGCIGVMLTRVFSWRAGATPGEARRLTLAPAVGEGLQLTNILLDWPADIRAGRCHIPAEWLRTHGLTLQDLTGERTPQVLAVVGQLEKLARAAFKSLPEYLETIPTRFVRYRQFCLWPALWALASLEHAIKDPDFPVGPARPKVTRYQLAEEAAVALALGHSRKGVRELFMRHAITQR